MSSGVRALAAASLSASGLDGLAARVADAAFDGAGRLDAVLGGATGGPVAPTAGDDGAGGDVELWLTGVRVEGFRGVAGEVALPLVPGPGLVLVVGRNGAGKSSLAEAAELALSGGSERSSSALWAEGLANLHHDAPGRVEVSVRVGAAPDVVVARTLDGDRVADGGPSASRGGEPFDLAALGWDEAVVRFRPVLTYGELAHLSSGRPSALYDPLNRILGLEELTVADGLLRAAETRLAQPGKDAAAARKSLLARLAVSQDSRAPALAAALAGRSPDAAAARAALGAGAPTEGGGQEGLLASWAALTGPGAEEAVTAAQGVIAAADRQDAAAAGQAGAAGRLARLLALAVEHREGPDDMCPVCGQGRLDDDWLVGARAETARQEALAGEAVAAARALDAAVLAARRLVLPVPGVLRLGPVGDADPSEALAAWEAWSALAAPGLAPRALADRLPAAAGAVGGPVGTLAGAARAAVDALDGQWRPLAEDGLAAVRLTEDAARSADGLAAVRAAKGWLKDAAEEIRNDRLRPFADQATEIWAGLRQESNVSLSGVTLAGQNTRREVRLDLAVDGAPGPRAVLSQGELAALGLALFLPRSVAPESPFRFVLVDDPVQSLDPSKVDGLARVLHRLAADRQVVVFTHDDRLLKSLRHLDLRHSAFRLARGERSAVTVEQVHDPVEQHLRDADALAKDTVLPPDLLALAVFGYCRDAIEEAAIEVAWRRLSAAGRTVRQVEEALEASSSTRARLGLALLDGRPRKGAVDGALAALGADGGVLAECIDGVHAPEETDLPALLDRTRAFVAALRSAA